MWVQRGIVFGFFAIKIRNKISMSQVPEKAAISQFGWTLYPQETLLSIAAKSALVIDFYTVCSWKHYMSNYYMSKRTIITSRTLRETLKQALLYTWTLSRKITVRIHSGPCRGLFSDSRGPGRAEDKELLSTPTQKEKTSACPQEKRNILLSSSSLLMSLF